MWHALYLSTIIVGFGISAGLLIPLLGTLADICDEYRYVSMTVLKGHILQATLVFVIWFCIFTFTIYLCTIGIGG